MSSGQLQKACCHNVIFPSKVATIPFTVPRLIDRRKHLWYVNEVSPSESSPPSINESLPARDVRDETSSSRWRSEPFLATSAIRRSNNKHLIQSSEELLTNQSCNSSLFGIDPTLYDENEKTVAETCFEEGNIGRLWFAIQYNPEAERLAVTLIQLKNLPSSVRGVNNGCDPYRVLKAYFCKKFPSDWFLVASSLMSPSNIPRMHHLLPLTNQPQVSLRDLRERSLKFTVYDTRSKSHVIIGHVTYPLKMYETSSKMVLWRDLECDDISHSGRHEIAEHKQLCVSLSYNGDLCRLTVGIYAGKNFTTEDGVWFTKEEENKPRLYVKVKLMQANRVLKSKKSEMVKFCSNPVFNEMFKIKLSPSDLNSVSLCIPVYLHKSHVKDVAIGRVVLGSFMFARGAELEHWTEMTSREKEQTTQWHSLTQL